MLPQKSRQKSSSISSVDSGLGHAIKKKSTGKLDMKKEMNYSQQLLHAASLTAKTQLLKKGLMNSNEKLKGFMNKISPRKKSDPGSDAETNTISSQFSPLACSTQYVKKFESISESSGEDEISTEKTVRGKRNTSSDSDAESLAQNVVNIAKKQLSKSNIESKKTPKINILDNQLIPSDSQNEADSDSKSVAAIHKSMSSSLSSDSENELLGLQSKRKKRNVKSLNSNKSQSFDRPKNSRTREEKESASSDSEKDHPHSVASKVISKSSYNKFNKKESEYVSALIDLENESKIKLKDSQKTTHEKNLGAVMKSRDASVRESDAATKRMKNFQKLEISASRNESLKPSRKDDEISSTESKSRKKTSDDESDSDGAFGSKPKQKILDKAAVVLENILSENEGYKKITFPHKTNLADIDSDDEVYLLQIPKSINPKIMEGVSFSLSKKSKLKMESGKYFIKRQSECTSSFLTYSNTLKLIRPLATLKMEKYVKSKGHDEIVVEERKKQPLPSNIKVRHPLFGSDYESKIQLDEQIKEKLEKALQRFHVKEKTPKRKKKIKEEVEDKNLLITKILEERFGNVSMTKNKNEELSSLSRTYGVIGEIKTEFFNQEIEMNDNVENTEEKKISHEDGCFKNSDFKTRIKTEVQDSSHLSNILVNESPKRKRKSKKLSETQELILVPSTDSTPKNFNIIKNEKYESEEETTIKQEMHFEVNHRIKKRKNSNKNMFEKVIATDVQSTNEISGENLHKKKEKKRTRRKTEHLEENLEIEDEIEKNKNRIKKERYNEIEEDIDGESTLKKKNKNKEREIRKELDKYGEFESNEVPLRKKKKKKQRDLEHTIMDDSCVKKEPLEECSARSPKKHKKSVLSSTRISENLDTSDFKVDVSKIDTEEPVVKREKNISDSEDNRNNDLISSLLFSVKNKLESTSDKNKKKKRKSN